MNIMNVSVIDWYSGYEFRNDVIKDILELSLNAKLTIVDSHIKSDIIFVGPYGDRHKHDSSFINSSAWKLYYTGENTIPDFRYVHHSLTFLRHSFNGRNFRLPLWWLHLSHSGFRESGSFDLTESSEFFTTNRPLQKYMIGLERRKMSVIAVFNHPDPLRLWTVQELGKSLPVEKYGKCFGNGFAWGDDGYQRKIQLISKYRFNYCPENSLSDGYFTEKILHSRLAGCIPIVYADKFVELDFNPLGLVNIYDYESVEQVVSYLLDLSQDIEKMNAIVNEPICTNMPKIDLLIGFLHESYRSFKNQELPCCTDVILPVTEIRETTFSQKFRRRLANLIR